jgi:hypothetical protein
LKPHWGISVVDFGYLPGRQKESLVTFAEGIFDVFVTRRPRNPKLQNLRSRRVAVITLSTKSTRMEDLTPLAQKIVAVLGTIKPGEVVHIAHSGND